MIPETVTVADVTFYTLSLIVGFIVGVSVVVRQGRSRQRSPPADPVTTAEVSVE